MNDALFNLYSITGDNDYFTTAYYFNHWSWTSVSAGGDAVGVCCHKCTLTSSCSHLPSVSTTWEGITPTRTL